MIEQLLKNILGDNGKTKIDINEIARNLDGKTELLGDLVDWEIGSNSNGIYFKHPSGLAICLFKGIPDSLTNTAGSVYRGELQNWYYPIDFNEPPFFVSASDNQYRWTTNRPLKDRGQVIQFGYTGNSTMIDSYCLAIGFIDKEVIE